MSFEAKLKDMVRTPVTLVKLTLDYCANTFSVAPCAASAALAPCYNTYHTYKAKASFVKVTKVYTFSSADAPPPFAGPRPYVKQVTYVPTEITDNVTVTGRIKVDLIDEPDGDIGIDPYVTQRPSWPDIPGTFCGKLLARNPNYKGRMLEAYEGFLGDPEAEFVKRANEPLEKVSIKKGIVTLETVDLLKGLGEIKVPAEVDIKLLNDIDAAVVEMILADTTDAANVAASGYVRIGDEVIQYANFDAAQRRLYNCTRGAFGTAAVAHSAKDAVQPCRYFAPGNPFDHLKTMLLTDAAYDPALVDSAAFDYWRDWPGGEVDMTALISEPTKLSEIYRGLVDLLDCKSWVAENLAITITRNIPNAPGRTYRAFSDADTVIKDSAAVDLNEDSRKTRCILRWDKSPLGKADENSSYARIDIGVDAAAETLEYGDEVAETIFTPWVKYGLVQDEVLEAFISDMLARRLFSRRDAAAILTLAVELKDSDIKTGEFITLATDEILNPDGMPVTTRFQVTRRDYKGSKTELKAVRMPIRRAAFYADEAALTYDAATPAQREYGGFYSDEATGKMPNGDDGFFYY